MPKKNFSIGYDRFKGCHFFSLLKGKRTIHEKYGLWICHMLSLGKSKPYSKPRPRYYEFYCISHLIKGHGWYWKEGAETQTLQAGQGVVIPPKQIQDFGSFKGLYYEDSVCFCGPVADQLFNSGILAEGIINIGHIRRLQPIIELATDPAGDSQIKANLALQTLITELYFENKRQGNQNKYSKIEVLQNELLKSPEKWWTVKDMAELCNLSINHFRRVFQSYAGMTPKRYIDELKIKKAAEYLCATEDTISTIADTFGFNDPFHFSRRFKEIIGISPDNYRKAYFKPQI